MRLPQCSKYWVDTLLLLVFAAGTAGAQTHPYRDASLPIDTRVRDLLGRLTLDEKFWQLYMIPGAPW